MDLKIYPIPTNNELIIERENLNDFKIAIFNLVGQNVNAKATFENNKVTLNTETLSDGIYLVQFQNNELKETRKIIVKH